MNATLKRLVGAFLLAGLPSALVVVVPAWAEPVKKHQQSNHAVQDANPQPIRQEGDEVTIEMSLADGFNPPSIEIKTGTTVTWVNVEPSDYPVVRGYHSVIADAGTFESPDIAPGQRWSYTFLEPGTFDYHCGVHPQVMTGQIVVTGQPVRPKATEARVEIVEPDANDDKSWLFKPDTISIEPGTTVIWANNGAQKHTVTDDDDAFDSGEMVAGDKFKFNFQKPGIYNYKCTPHPWMQGVVKVHEPGKAPPQEEPEESKAPASSSTSSSTTSSASSGSGPATHQVGIVEGESVDSWGFDPPSLNVAVGDTVVWTNTGEIDHTATSKDGTFDSGTVPPGGTFEFTFDEIGEFAYQCTPHPFMTGTINVSESPAPNSGAGGTDAAAGSTTAGTDMGSMETASDEPLSSEEEITESEPVTEVQLARSLTGKEASLGAVVVVLSTALAFLVGRWWGQSVGRRGKAGIA